MNTRTLLSVVVAASMLGCSGSDTGSSTGALTIEETADGVSGSFIDESERDLGRIDFTGRYVDTNVVEIVLRFHGMAVTQLADLDTGVVEFDGFGDAGGETQMMMDDHALLLELAHALQGLGDTSDELGRVRNFASWWSEFPSGMEMQWQGIAPEDRTGSSLCGIINSYRRTTHDGWFESSGSDSQILDGGWVSWDGACQATNAQDGQGTWWWNGSAWTCPGSEPNHSTSIEYAQGECFGQCGAGCGGRYQVFSSNCAEHDFCNRFGHSWAASLPGGHCADEFADSGIDIVVLPNCDRGW